MPGWPFLQKNVFAGSESRSACSARRRPRPRQSHQRPARRHMQGHRIRCIFSARKDIATAPASARSGCRLCTGQENFILKGLSGHVWVNSFARPILQVGTQVSRADNRFQHLAKIAEARICQTLLADAGFREHRGKHIFWLCSGIGLYQRLQGPSEARCVIPERRGHPYTPTRMVLGPFGSGK